MCWFAPIPPTSDMCIFFFSGNLEGPRVTCLWKVFSLPSALGLEGISCVFSLVHAELKGTSHGPFITSLGLAARVNEGQ